MRNTKKKISALLALLSFTAYMPVSCGIAMANNVNITSTTLPDLKDSINGTVTQSGNTMYVDNNTYAVGTVSQFDWNSFNVGKDAEVNFGFSANHQTILNRVMASGGMSEIYGRLSNRSLTSCASCVNTGKIILINPSGVLFGQGAHINVNSLTASTFDIKGAKDISSMTASELATYKGFNETTRVVSGGLVDMAGYNKNVSFVGNNNMVSEDGNGVIKVNANGTRLASIVSDGAELIYGDKNVAFVGNRIDVKDTDKISSRFTSVPNTGTRYDENGKAVWNDEHTATEYFQTRSGVKFVTGDGVNFYYQPSGGIVNLYNGQRDGSAVSTALPYAYTRTADNMVAGQEYGVNISNSTITTGNFDIHNGVDSSTNSSVNIDNSIIQAKKILGADSYSASGAIKYYAEDQGTSGGVWVTGAGKLNITNSDIQSENDTVQKISDKGGVSHTVTGADISGGHIVLHADEDINITNTYIRTSDSTKNTEESVNSSMIHIVSKDGDINFTKTNDAPSRRLDGQTLYTQVQAAGGMTVNAENGDINVDGYDKLWALGDTEISGVRHRSIDAMANNINLKNTLVNSGDINLDAANQINTYNATVQAVSELNLSAKDTTLDSSAIAYTNASFYDSTSNVNNNLTIQNGTTFKNPTGNTVIETNGKITVDGSDLKGRYYGESATNQKSITLISTKDDIVINNADVQTTDGSITATAQNGTITVTDASLYATSGDENYNAKNISIDNATVWAQDGNVNLTATTDKVTAVDSVIAAEGGNTTINQVKSVDIDSDFNGSTVAATGKLTVNTDGNITGTRLASGTGYIQSYTGLASLNNTTEGIKFIYDRAEFNADGDITATNAQSLKQIDLVAGGNIDLDSLGNMTLTDVSTKSVGTTDLAAAGRLLTNGYDIEGATKTTLNGNTVMSANDTTIDANGNKLAINSDYTVNVAVTGVNNADKGIEVNAGINTSNGSSPLTGKAVTINATDGTLAISKIKADTLNLTADNILSSATTISTATDNIDKLAENNVSTAAKAYIEVAKDGGFNLDPTTVYNDTNSGIYTGGDYGSTATNKTNLGLQYSTSDTQVVAEVENSTLISSNIVKGDEAGRQNISKTEISSVTSDPVTSQIIEEDGSIGFLEETTTTTTYQVVDNVTYNTTQMDTYRDTKTTTTETTTNTYQDYQITTTGTDTQHIATLNNNEQDAFVLVYGKTDSSTRTGTELISTTTKTDTNTEVVNNARVVNTPGTTVEQDVYNVQEVTVNRVYCHNQEVSENNEETLEGGIKRGTSSGGSEELVTSAISNALTTSTLRTASKKVDAATVSVNTLQNSTTSKEGANNQITSKSKKFNLGATLDEELDDEYFNYLY